MIRVRCIFVETTVPVRMRPRIETRPVKGHFLSADNRLISIQIRRKLQTHPCMPSIFHPLRRPQFESPSPDREVHRRTDIAALNGSLGGTEPKTDVLVPSPATLAGPGGLDLDLGVLEDVRLLLESPLGLDSELGRHDVGCGRY